MTLYQITDEAVKINELFENAVDENGELLGGLKALHKKSLTIK